MDDGVQRQEHTPCAGCEQLVLLPELLLPRGLSNRALHDKPLGPPRWMQRCATQSPLRERTRCPAERSVISWSMLHPMKHSQPWFHLSMFPRERNLHSILIVNAKMNSSVLLFIAMLMVWAHFMQPAQRGRSITKWDIAQLGFSLEERTPHLTSQQFSINTLALTEHLIHTEQPWAQGSNPR